jgi:serine/threonine-protein kinase
LNPDPRLVSALSDRYRLERELGHGGMAVVYLAHDLKHDRQVALKVIKPELAGVIGGSRFSREIKVAARLQHPHICSVYDSGATADDQLWYTMPFVAGRSLRDRLNEAGRLPVPEAVRIIREAAQALEYAHKQGVIHRDIKPENILLTEDGTTLVADFGIAKGVTDSERESSTQLTATGFALGTPAYMSPEQRIGAPVDGRTDVYSLAITLYELLLGELPPLAGDFFQARKTDATASLGVKRPEIGEALRAVVQRGIEVDSAQRYQSMTAFRQALDAVITGSHAATVHAGPAVRRGLVALAVVAVMAVGWMAWRQWGGGSRRTVVALLPFTTAPGDTALQDIAWDFMEDLRRTMPHVPGFAVTTEAASQRVTGGRLTSKEIADRLGAGVVVTSEAKRTADGFALTFAVTRPARSAEVRRATISGTLQQLVDWRDSITTTVLQLAEARPDPEAVHAAERYQIATSVAPAYALYARVMRENNTDTRQDLASWKEVLAREDSILALDPRFIDALSDRGMFTLFLVEGFSNQLSSAEASAAVQHSTELLRQAQAVDPNHPLTNRLAGYLMLSNGDTAGALPIFRTAAAEEPIYQLLSDLCSVEITRARPPAPIPQSCRQLVASDSLNPLALMSASGLFYNNRRYAESLIPARAAARLEPTVAAYHMQAYWSLLALHRYQDALQETRQALAINPRDPETHRAMGVLLLQLERPEEALVEARAWVEALPNDLAARDFLSSVQARAGKPEDGLVTARGAASAFPNSPAAHLLLGQRLWDTRQFDSALKEFSAAAALDTRTPTRLFFLSAMNRLAGRMGDAQAALDRGTSFSAGAPFSLGASARYLQWLGKMADAAATYRRLVAIDSTHAGPWVSLSYAEILAGRLDSARVDAERAIAIDSTFASGWSNLALSESLLGKQSAAIAASDGLRRMGPNDQETIAQQIWFYARGGRTAESAAKLDSLERRFQRYGPSLVPMVIAYSGVGDTTRARQALAASVVNRDRGWLNFSLDDPMFADLRGTPEFQEAKRQFLQSGDVAGN